MLYHLLYPLHVDIGFFSRCRRRGYVADSVAPSSTTTESRLTGGVVTATSTWPTMIKERQIGPMNGDIDYDLKSRRPSSGRHRFDSLVAIEQQGSMTSSSPSPGCQRWSSTPRRKRSSSVPNSVYAMYQRRKSSECSDRTTVTVVSVTSEA